MDPRIENNADRLSKSHNWFDIAHETFKAAFNEGYLLVHDDNVDVDKLFATWLKEPHDD